MEKTLSLYFPGDKPGRLDTYISEKARISRTRAHKLIEDGLVTLNDKTDPKPGSRLKEGDVMHVRIPFACKVELQKEKIPLDIVYEDEHLIVINKERGMVVHPAPGHQDGTIANALLYHAEEVENVGSESRPGIVHRLDKNTSGLLIAAKTEAAHQKLCSLFQLRKIKKEYLAVIHGKLKGREGMINLPIGRDPADRKKMAVVPNGKSAVTRWKLKKSFKNYCLLSVFIETGRTHQIRVHMKYLGSPVVGDPEYGPNIAPPTDIQGQALHAAKLSFEHPITGKPMDLEAPMPYDMRELIEKIEES